MTPGSGPARLSKRITARRRGLDGRPRGPTARRGEGEAAAACETPPSTPSPSRHRVGAHISGWDSLVRDAHRHATAQGSPEISDARTKSALFPGPSAGE